MDISIVQASAFQLPTSRRAGALVYDGTVDLDLWRPPGPDRDLREVYGDELQEVLEKERARTGEVEVGTPVRLHPGKLHCDFIIWMAGRPPHGHERASAAPGLEVIEQLVERALEFASERSVERVAFPALGAGRGAAETHERLAAVARAAERFKLACFNAGRPSGVEDVLVCDPSGTAVVQAKRLVSHVIKTSVTPPAASTKVRPRRERKQTTNRRTARKASAPAGLDPDAVAAARTHAAPYDRTHTYSFGDWLVHPSFGIGRIQEVDNERRIRILFESGAEKTLIHSR